MRRETKATLLALETSGASCSVALQMADGAVHTLEGTAKNEHSGQLTVMIQGLLESNGITLENVDAVVVGAGPGSYTGLRIGYATAKGMCFGAGKPLIAVSGMVGLATGILADVGKRGEDVRVVPMVDARRMEVYTQTFDGSMHALSEVKPLILTEELPPKEQGKTAYYAGSGARKAQDLLRAEDGWVYVDREEMRACDLLEMGEIYFMQGKMEDLAYAEPQYLKEFMASLPKAGVLDHLRRVNPSRGDS